MADNDPPQRKTRLLKLVSADRRKIYTSRDLNEMSEDALGDLKKHWDVQFSREMLQDMRPKDLEALFYSQEEVEEMPEEELDALQEKVVEIVMPQEQLEDLMKQLFNDDTVDDTVAEPCVPHTKVPGAKNDLKWNGEKVEYAGYWGTQTEEYHNRSRSDYGTLLSHHKFCHQHLGALILKITKFRSLKPRAFSNPEVMNFYAMIHCRALVPVPTVILNRSQFMTQAHPPRSPAIVVMGHVFDNQKTLEGFSRWIEGETKHEGRPFSFTHIDEWVEKYQSIHPTDVPERPKNPPMPEADPDPPKIVHQENPEELNTFDFDDVSDYRKVGRNNKEDIYDKKQSRYGTVITHWPFLTKPESARDVLDAMQVTHLTQEECDNNIDLMEWLVKTYAKAGRKIPSDVWKRSYQGKNDPSPRTTWYQGYPWRSVNQLERFCVWLKTSPDGPGFDAKLLPDYYTAYFDSITLAKPLPTPGPTGGPPPKRTRRTDTEREEKEDDDERE